MDPRVLLLRLRLAIAAPRARDERGDVPGWVLVTIMSVGIVIAIWNFAETELTEMLRSALNKVR